MIHKENSGMNFWTGTYLLSMRWKFSLVMFAQIFFLDKPKCR
jgi:hypothetical protein